jgi:hypothetical protein
MHVQSKWLLLLLEASCPIKLLRPANSLVQVVAMLLELVFNLQKVNQLVLCLLVEKNAFHVLSLIRLKETSKETMLLLLSVLPLSMQSVLLIRNAPLLLLASFSP